MAERVETEDMAMAMAMQAREERRPLMWSRWVWNVKQQKERREGGEKDDKGRELRCR